MTSSDYSTRGHTYCSVLMYHLVFFVFLLFLFLYGSVCFDDIFNYKLLIYPSYYKSLLYYFYGKIGFLFIMGGILLNIGYIVYSILKKTPITKRILLIHSLSGFHGSILGYYFFKKIFFYYGFLGQIGGFFLFETLPYSKKIIFIVVNLLSIFMYLKINIIIYLYQFIKTIVVYSKIPLFISIAYNNLLSWILFLLPFTKKIYKKNNNSIEKLIYKSIYKDFSSLHYLYDIPLKSTPYNTEEISLFDLYKNTYGALQDYTPPSPQTLSPEEVAFFFDALSHFSIQGIFEQGLQGPLITTIIMTPNKDTKLHSMYHIEADLGRILGKSDLRIIYPIKDYPHSISFQYSHNKIKEINFVSFLANSEFLSLPPLHIIIGVDTYGYPCFLNIEEAPHILVSGTTGSGKSSLLQTIITTLLWKNTPSFIEIILIDPKKSEFFIFQGFPHIKYPIAYSLEDIKRTVDKLIDTMEERYTLLNKNKAKNIYEYNNNHLRLPYIVICVDEYADIVIQSKTLETKFLRLLQMGRAAGIHLIIATQRPSAEIITGTLKSNLPVRIACKVINALNSKIIIDEEGAEKLLGNGDMIIFLHGKYIRAHGFYVKKEFLYALKEILLINEEENKNNTQ